MLFELEIKDVYRAISSLLFAVDHSRDQALMPVPVSPDHSHQVKQNKCINQALNETVYLLDIAVPLF